MPMPFDATLKGLAVVDPARFPAEFDGTPTAPVRLLNVDLSTVTASTDIAFGLGDPLTEVVHLDVQAGPDAGKDRDILAYNSLLFRQYSVPVHSSLVLLRPRAQHPNLTGRVRYEARPGRGRMDFGYEIVRLWQRPAAVFLAGGPGTVPLAPLGKLPEGMSREDGLRWVVDQVVQRLQSEGEALRGRLLTATFVLSGLVADRSELRSLFQGVRAVRESEAYQMILDEGGIQAVQQTLLRLGRRRFGEPDETTRQALLGIENLERLQQLTEDLLDLSISSWQELLVRSQR